MTFIIHLKTSRDIFVGVVFHSSDKNLVLDIMCVQKKPAKIASENV